MKDVRSRRANILMNFISGGLHDEGDLSVTKNRELLSLLEDPISSLRIGHLPVSLVLYQLDLNLPTTHFSNFNLLPPSSATSSASLFWVVVEIKK